MTIPRFITFDCYGTLIDFDLGSAAVETLGDRMVRVEKDAFLSAFEQMRFDEVLGEYKPYRDVLKASLRKTMAAFGLEYRESDGESIVSAVPGFGPFPEVPAVLECLVEHTHLVVITNSDNDLIPSNIEKIGVPFHRVITSEDVGAYKPSVAVFDYVLRELGCRADEILHVAQGFNYDIVPAHAVGWERVWINRRGQPGDPSFGPYRELTDLTGLPDVIGL